MNKAKQFTSKHPSFKVYKEFITRVEEGASSKSAGLILQASDSVRDQDLIEFGIRIEDRQDDSIWKFENKEILL